MADVSAESEWYRLEALYRNMTNDELLRVEAKTPLERVLQARLEKADLAFRNARLCAARLSGVISERAADRAVTPPL